MKKQRIYQISSLIASVALLIGCSSDNGPKVTEKPKVTQAVQKPAPVPVKKPEGISISQLNSGGVTSLALKGPKTYRENEPIQFIIDTKDKEGYLYILYSDTKGNVALLYPNPKAPLSEIGGRYIFPRDFGNMNIRATKDCKDCKEETTVIYALLSKKPILDIQNITQPQLINIVEGNSKKSSGSAQSKGLSMDLDNGSGNSNANINIGRFQFTVKDR